MKRIDESSHNVEQKHHAKANKFSDTDDYEKNGAGSGLVEEKTPGFSKAVASIRNEDGEKLGAASALVLRYLSHQVRKFGSLIDGKKWWRMKLDHIASKYPYLGRSTVDDAIQRIISIGACEVDNLNAEHFGRPRFDRTRAYHVPKKWMDAAEEEPRYFSEHLAGVIGISAAVIYRNFTHWVAELEKQEKGGVVTLSPSRLAEVLPFNISTIKRAIEDLKEFQMIIPVKGERCGYTMGPVKCPSSKPDEISSKPDKVSSKPDEISSKPDNDIDCSLIVDVLEKNSKTEPAALLQGSPPVVGEQKKAPGIVHQQLVNTTPEEQQRKETDNEAGNPSSGKNSSVISRSEWHKMNQDIAPVVARIRDSSSKFSDPVVKAVQGVAAKFLGHLDIHQVDRLCDEATDEEIFDELAPIYLAFFDKLGISLTPQVFEIVHYGAFECVLGAFWQHEHHEVYSHPIHLFIRVSYNLFLDLRKRSEQRRLKSVEEEFAERAKEFASPDEHLEHCDDLSPAQKTRIFKQGLSSRNKIGGIHFDQVLRTDEIKLSTAGFRSITGLFINNPQLTAANLLAVMDGCLKLHRSKPAPREFKRGVQWHARMGHNLTTFGRYLRTIIKQLGMSETCPVKVWPSGAAQDDDEELMAA